MSRVPLFSLIQLREAKRREGLGGDSHQHVRHTLSTANIRINNTYISSTLIMLAVRLDPVETESMQKCRKTLDWATSNHGSTHAHNDTHLHETQNAHSQREPHHNREYDDDDPKDPLHS